MKTLAHILHARSRGLTLVALFALGWLLSGSNAPAATVSWSGTGGDELWSNPLNWTGGVLPTSDDDVIINVPGATTVRMDAGNVAVRSLQCEESFILQNGSFILRNGASVINGAFSVLSFQSLTVDGATATLTVNSSVTNLAGLLNASGGGVINLPTARNLFADGNYLRSLNASGAGSAINLTNLTNLVVSASGYWLQANAYDGGRIDLRQLRATEGYVIVGASGPSSLVDLTSLSGLWSPGPSGYRISVSASDGGTVAIPNVTALDQADLNISGSGNLPTAQLRSFTGGSLTLTSRTNGFTGLTNFNGSISAYDSRLDWTNLTVLYVTNNSMFNLTAYQGSVIDLSRITNVVLNPGYGMNVGANAGSRIDLSRLRLADGALMYVIANNEGSLVDLSGLTGLWDGNGSSVKADDGGTVLIPNVTAMNKVSIELRRTAIVPTVQLRSFTDGFITLYNRTNGFAGLTNFTGYFYVTDTRLDLTNFTVLYATNNYVYFQAEQGSFIDLSRLTNVVTTSVGYGLSPIANGGSRIDLHRLLAPEGLVNVGASGADSLVDLSGINGVWRGGGYGSVTAGSGGTVLMPNVTALDGVSLNVSDSASVNLAQLNSIIVGSVTLHSRTNDLTGLTNFTGSLTAYDSQLELTNLTVLYVTNGSIWFRANQDSVLNLSYVTNVVFGSGGYGLHLEANGGGRIDMSRLGIPSGPVNVQARYENSVVDLSGLTGLWTYGSVGAWNGATVLIPNVTAMEWASLNLRSGAIVPMTQLRSLIGSSVYLETQTNLFAELTNFTGTFAIFDGRAELPSLKELNATNYPISFTASGGSVIDLSQATNAVVETYWLNFAASSDSRVKLPNLESIVAGAVSVQANGTDAVVDLTGLTGFFSVNNAGSLYSANGGTILLNSDAMLLAGVAIDFRSNPGGPVPPFLAASQSLVLYGQPWRSYRIESRDLLDAGSPWHLYKRIALTEALQLIGTRPPVDLVLRVYAFIANPPELDMQVPNAGLNQVILFGVPEQTYRLESTASLDTSINWENGPTTTLTNSFLIFPSAGTTNTARFYRARQL